MVRPRENWSTRVDRWRDAATLTIVLAGAFAIPLVFQRNAVDVFRLPKTVLCRAEAILIVSVTLAGFLLGAPIPRLKWRDPWLLLPLLAYLAFIVLTLTSTNRELSMGALGSASATLVVFYAAVAVARRHGWILLGAPLAAAVGNALLVIAEETNLWMPFGVLPRIPHHLQCDALVGNPNEVGSYLGAAALASLAVMSTRFGGKKRTVRNVIVAAALVAGLVASQTLTAIVAFAAGALFMLAISSWRNALLAAAAGVATAAFIIALAAPIRARATNVVRWIARGNYNRVFTERFTPFVAAWSMFVEHPLAGVGPGAFAWQYYDHKILAERRHPKLRRAYNRGVNYGEVHNDHLQVLAEGGIVGYAAFGALLGALACVSFTIPANAPDERQRFARRLGLSLAVFWAVLSLAQFPLETTVVRSLLVHLAALCVGWRTS